MSNEIESDSPAPNLHEQGKPWRALVDMPDGSRSFYPLPQTKWDNCMSLTGEVNGRPVSAADLTRWELTRREYEHFLAVYAQSTHANGTLPVETDGASDAFVAGQPRREPAGGRS